MCGINMDLSPSHPSDLMFMPQNYKARIRSQFYPFTTVLPWRNSSLRHNRHDTFLTSEYIKRAFNNKC